MRGFILCLLLIGNATAANLYTITVKTEHAVRGAIIKAIALNKVNAKAVEKSGDWVTFKLPAGKYKFVAMPKAESKPNFTGGQVVINVKADTEVTIPVEYTGNY